MPRHARLHRSEPYYRRLTLETLEDRRLLADGTAEILGTKWNDVDGDRTWDIGEPALAGVVVYLDANENGQPDAGEPQRVTDEHGAYAFTGLAAGTYVVREVVPDGWRQTSPVVRDISLGGASLGAASVSLSDLTTTGSTAAVDLPSDVVAADEVNAQTDVSTSLIRMDQFRADTRFAGVDGSGLATVVLDTGIDLDHPFFGPDSNGDGIADRIVYNYDFYNNDADGSDDNGHGSNVSSIIASQDATYRGMAPGANIIALKVLSNGNGGDFGTIERALQWVVANASTYHIASVDMSLSDNKTYTTPQSLYGLGDELAALAGLGVIVVSSSGNSFYPNGSRQGVAYPSADPNSLSIGAVYDADVGNHTYTSGAVAYSTGADRIAPFSQRHETMTTVFAPGAPITGANATGGTVTYHGTSQAAPHIAGIALLAQELAQEYLGRWLTPAEFASLLRDTGVTINDGDDEDDNVVNTGLDFRRVDMLALAEAIWLMQAPPGSQVVELTSSEVVSGVNFGNQILPGQVDGTVWNDVDGDQARDAGELGLANVTVYADLNGNGTLDRGEPSDVTDASGNYLLVELTPGQHAISTVLSYGWQSTTPVSGTNTVTVVTQQTTHNIDFGIRDITGTVRGSAWNDLDSDQVRDLDEPSLASLVVFADLNNNGQLDANEPRALSGVDGTYALERLLPQAYTIAAVVPEGWRQSLPASGTHHVTLATQQTVEGIDFANEPIGGEIRGVIWSDPDSDGVRDPGEAGLDNVTVYLDLDYDGQIEVGEPTTLTRADDPSTPDVDETGMYAFGGLQPGTYAVGELAPTGYVQAFPVRDQNVIRRVSLTYQGGQARYASLIPCLSDDGRYAIFTSGSNDLVPVPVSGIHVFVRDIIAGTTECVSVNNAGQPGHPQGFTSARIDISPGGRYAVFASDAADLVPGDTNRVLDVFLRDRQLGITERMSIAPDGTEPNGNCDSPVVSDDGRYVVFNSSASNLVPNDDNNADDVYLYDRQARTLRLVSTGLDGRPANGYSRWADISGDGRYVVFESNATNLVPEDTSIDPNAFLYDTQTGQLQIVSRTRAGEKAGAFFVRINTDGRFVAFTTYEQLDPTDNDHRDDIYIRDRQTGEVRRASRSYDGSDGGDYGIVGAISTDGQYVAFVSDSYKFVPHDNNFTDDIFFYSVDTDSISRISVTPSGGQLSERSDRPSISAGGRFVGFESFASDIVPRDTNGYCDIFAYTRDNYGQHLIAVAQGQMVEQVNFGNHDVVAPEADVVDVAPDPHSAPVDQITIVFTEPVTGFGLSDLRLSIGDGPDLLRDRQTLVSVDATTWTLGGLAGLTTSVGTYTLTLVASGSGIVDTAGNLILADAGDSWTLNNYAPIDILLSADTLIEHQPVGTVVGSISTIDPDSDTGFTYALVSGAGDTDNVRFTIVGGELRTAAILDYEIAPSYSVRVRTTDTGGQPYEKVLTIHVTDVYEFTACGVYDPKLARFYLRNTNTQGPADTSFLFGAPGWEAISGDWDGDGKDTIGAFQREAAQFYLRNSNDAGSADVSFGFGVPGSKWILIMGDWNGDGVDTIGAYDPATSQFYLKNSNSQGNADLAFGFGAPRANWTPVVGDWNGDGVDTIGLYDPWTGMFYLRNTFTTGMADVAFAYGLANHGWQPLVGDWEGDGIDTIGMYLPYASTFFLRNSNTIGNADVAFGLGYAGCQPIIGDWLGRDPVVQTPSLASPQSAGISETAVTDAVFSQLDDDSLSPLALDLTLPFKQIV